MTAAIPIAESVVTGSTGVSAEQIGASAAQRLNRRRIPASVRPAPPTPPRVLTARNRTPRGGMSARRAPVLRPFGGMSTRAGSAAHKIVIAEFIVCVFLIGVTPVLMRKPQDSGQLYVPNDLIRLSACCLLFFVLALLSNSPGSSRVAAAFGGLVTLGVTYNASASLKTLGNIFVNAGTRQGGGQ